MALCPLLSPLALLLSAVSCRGALSPATVHSSSPHSLHRHLWSIFTCSMFCVTPWIWQCSAGSFKSSHLTTASMSKSEGCHRSAGVKQRWGDLAFMLWAWNLSQPPGRQTRPEPREAGVASCPSSQGARLPPHVHLKSSFLCSDRWAALDAGPCPWWASSLRTLAASVTPVQWVVSSLQFLVQLFAGLRGNTLQGTERSVTCHWVLPTCKQYIEFFIKNFKSLYLVCYSIASVSWGFFWLHCLWDPSFLTRARTHSPCTGRQSLIHWTAREVWPVSMLYQLEQARGSLPSRQTRNMWPHLGQMPLHGCTARRASLGWSLRPPSQHRTWTPVECCILSLGSLSLSCPLFTRPARTWPPPLSLSSMSPFPRGPCRPCPPWLCKLSCVLGFPLLQPTAHPPVTVSLFAGVPHACNSDPVKARTLFYLILVLSPGFASQQVSLLLVWQCGRN